MMNMPQFEPLDIKQIGKKSYQGDVTAYERSDQDFSQRHAPMLQAENLFQTRVLRDQRNLMRRPGDYTLMPQIQNEFLRSGLENSLSAFGDSMGTLAPNSAGEANVARNLGMDIMGFQDRNRQNRIQDINSAEQSLGMAEQMFPRRTFGLTGENIAQMMMMNNQGLNNWNQADYSLRFQEHQQNQQLAAQKKAAQMQMVMAVAQSIGQVAGAAAGACWVARAVFGTDNPRWVLFRSWLFDGAPEWFRDLYLRVGERFAEIVRRNRALRCSLYPFFWIISEIQLHKACNATDLTSNLLAL